jgi:hypothetical protein
MVDYAIANQIRPFQLPDIAGIAGAMQGLELNRMRSQQLQGAERERNAMRALFSDPNFNPSDPAQARRVLEVAPQVGPATYSALLRGYADQRAAEASARAGAAAGRQAELANVQIEQQKFNVSRQELIGLADLPEDERQAAWGAWRERTMARMPYARNIPREYSPGAYASMLSTAGEIAARIAAQNKPPEAFTLSPGQTRFSGTGQPIASSDVRDPAREVKIRDIMDTQNIPRSIAVGIVDNVLRPIQDPVSGQTRLFNLANNTFVEFAPAGSPAPTATPGGEPPVNAMTAPTSAAVAPASLAAGPRENAFQLPTFPPPRTHMEAEQQRALRNMAVEIEKNRVEAARRRAEQPERVLEAGQTAGATARAQADVRREEQPARVEEAGKTAGAETTARLEAEEAVKRRQDAERLETAIREVRNLTRPGGLLQQATGSGVGTGVDWTLGQIGVSTRASRAAAQLAPIADMVLKMVPRFEGPQSENDRKSYEAAAGRLADSTRPNEDRLAAARVLIRIMEERRGQFTTNPIAPPGGTAGASPTSSAASAIPPPPAGMSQSDWGRLWGVMKPEERALWQN